MPSVRRIQFTGGINQQLDPTKLDPTADYYLAVNARTRRNVVDPVKLPVEVTPGLSTPGLIQGIYAAGSTLLMFVDGAVYYKDYSSDSNPWVTVTGLSMSATAPRIYVELLPASTVNYGRQLQTTSDASSGVKLYNEVPISNPCAVVMDGVSQPWIIFADGSARVTKTYTQWIKETVDQEYVPAAAIMPMYYNGKLYCVGKDTSGRYTQIYHSVTGRPLDFIIAVDTSGDKISAFESEGGAGQLATAVSYEEITCVKAVDAIEGAFLVTTAKSSHLVMPSYETTLFGEPTFVQQYLFSVGALNNLCAIDILGDVALIHYNGIRSFNGIKQARFEGQNAPFSARINSLIDGIYQEYAAAATFDNYALFALMTKHGPGILVYDTLLQRFVSLDIYPTVGQIKQFAEVRTATTHKLFFITTDNKLYQAYAGTTVATCGLYLNEIVPETGGRSQHKITDVTAVFGDVAAAGYVQCEIFSDKQHSKPQAQTLSATSYTPSTYTSIPYDPTLEKAITTSSFNWTDKSEFSHRLGVMLSWNADAPLIELLILTEEQLTPSPEISTMGPWITLNPTKLAFFGDTSTGGVHSDVISNIAKFNPTCIIGVGDFTSDGFVTMESWRDKGKFRSTAGNHDIEVPATWFPWIQQPPTHYFSEVFGPVEIFFVVDGYNSVETQLMPYNKDKPLLVDCEQYVWLKAALAASTAPFKFVIWHKPPYTSGVTHAGKVAMRAIPIADWGANALLSGHNHQYERLYVNGITHYVVGTGGGGLYDFNATPDPYSITRIKSYGHLQATFYALSAVLTFVDDTGEEYDTIIIRP